MSHKQNIIELNGKRYDARTGHPVTHGHAAAKSHQHKSGAAKHTKIIDDFISRPAKSKHHKKTAPNGTSSRLVHSKPTRSQTLMRKAVAKPPANSSAAKIQKLAEKHADPKRAIRANKIAKSHLISRFGGNSSGISARIEPISVREAPNEELQAVHSEPSILPEHTLTISPFEKALKNATSHTHPKHKKSKSSHRLAKRLRMSPKALNLAASAGVLLLIGGAVAYRSLPSVAVHLASSRAGVQASLPGYHPAGFSLAGPVQYGEGQLTLRYQSNSDARQFSLVQQKSNWSSQNLKNNFVAAKDNTFQEFNEKGKIVYIYGDNNATWVNGGVWYTLEGDSALSPSQLLKIAASM